jgi:phage tail-like protein
MANPARNDPYSALNFFVEIDGITVAGFSECSGLSTETDVIEYREGGEPTRPRKLPGLTRYAPIVLKRGITKNRDLWKWRKTVIDGRVSRRSVSIILLDEERKEVARWNVVNAWPSKWEGPHLNAKTSEVALETLELVHEGLDLE